VAPLQNIAPDSYRVSRNHSKGPQRLEEQALWVFCNFTVASPRDLMSAQGSLGLVTNLRSWQWFHFSSPIFILPQYLYGLPQTRMGKLVIIKAGIERLWDVPGRYAGILGRKPVRTGKLCMYRSYRTRPSMDCTARLLRLNATKTRAR